MKHLIFYDSHCPFCQRAVSFLRKRDQHHRFKYYPLTSKIGRTRPLTQNTLTLAEQTPQGERLWIRGSAVCRILTLLGGPWRLFALLTPFPWLTDPLYRLIAKHRHLI